MIGMRQSRKTATLLLALAAILSIPACSLPLPVSPGSSPAPLIPDCIPTDTEQEQAMTDTTSRLDEAGREQIRATCQATFDLSQGQLLKADLGLGLDEHVSDIAPGGLITLRLIGSKGTLEARTDRVRFFTMPGKPELSIITYFLASDTLEEYFEIVRAGVDAFGLDEAVIERWIESTILSPETEDKFALDPGYKLGFQVVYDLRYKGPDRVNTIIVSVGPGKSESR